MGQRMPRWLGAGLAIVGLVGATAAPVHAAGAATHGRAAPAVAADPAGTNCAAVKAAAVKEHARKMCYQITDLPSSPAARAKAEAAAPTEPAATPGVQPALSEPTAAAGARPSAAAAATTATATVASGSSDPIMTNVPVQLDMPWCQLIAGNAYSRFETCLRKTLTADLIDEHGAVIGVASFGINQYMRAEKDWASFTQSVTVIPLRIDATLGEVTGAMGLTCTSSTCNAATPLQWNPLAWSAADMHWVEYQQIFSWANASVPNTQDTMGTIFSFAAKSSQGPNAVAFPLVADYQSELRCDSKIAGMPSRCVFYHYTPTVMLNPSTAPAAVLFVNHTQRITGWGLKSQNKPLHREANDDVRKANRSRLCDSTFRANADTDAYAKQDNAADVTSCDEYPFAATQESGLRWDGTKVLTGLECTQFYAYRWPEGQTGWSTPTDDRDYSNPVGGKGMCGRANIPNLQNGNVGSQLGTLYQTQRILDGEAFYVDSGTVDKPMSPPADPSSYNRSTTLQPQSADVCLGIWQGSTAGAAQAIQWECNNNPDQSWRFTHTPGTRIYTITNDNSGLCLDVNGASTSPGANVIQWYCNGAANQQWEVFPSGNGWTVKSVNSGLCLGIRNGDTGWGAEAIQWNCNGNPDQVWT